MNSSFTSILLGLIVVSLLTCIFIRVCGPPDLVAPEHSEQIETTTLTPLEFITQPLDYTCSDGDTVDFSVALNYFSTVVNYQWQKCLPGSDTFYDIPGAIYSIYSFVSGSELDGCLYRCICTCNGESIISDDCLLTVLSSELAAVQPTTEGVEEDETSNT